MFSRVFLSRTTNGVDETFVVDVPVRLVSDVAVDTADATGELSEEHA